MSLIETWLASRSDESIQSALDQLNADLGTRYKHNHLSMWRNGVRSPGGPVILYMIENSLPYALKTSGFIPLHKVGADPHSALAQCLALPSSSPPVERHSPSSGDTSDP